MHSVSFVIIFSALVRVRGLVYDAPKASVSEYYEDVYYENVRPIRASRNGEIIVGEQTSKSVKKLLFECTAGYPVQWIYNGDGVPEIATDTNVRRNQGNTLNGGDYGATLQINQLTEGHTGNYTCRGTQNRNAFVSYHLYVPGEKLFTSDGNQNVTFSKRDSTVRIPCSVSHPSVRVTLQRTNNGYVKCPLNNSLHFDPKNGFILRVQELRDVAGEYVCTGSMNDNNFKVINFRLVQQYETIRSNCNPNPCGVNAECLLSRGRVICTCIGGYTGDPFVQCRRAIGGLDPCSPSPCGKYGDCVVRNGLAACTCRPGYQGKPPHCTSAQTRCYIHQDCQPNEMCIERQCSSLCDKQNRCGRNAQCQVINRTPVCSCPAGFVGDGYQDCIQERYPAPYEELEERLRPECVSDGECPRFLACIHQKCQNPCPSVCGRGAENCFVDDHKATCNGLRINCPPGDPSCSHRGPIGGCQRANCGPNSECKDVNGQAVCSCLPGSTGSPPQCSSICFGNSGCPGHLACQARKCQDPCNGHICGVNSKCIVNKHKPECQCLEGYVGDGKKGCNGAGGTLLTPSCPLRCRRGSTCKFVSGTPTCSVDQSCFADTECPSWLGCFNGECKNPCEVFQTLCGENQQCQVVNHKAECTCRPGFPVRINNDCYQDGFKERSFNEQEEDDHFHHGVHCSPPYCRTGDPRMEKHQCRFNGDCPRGHMCINLKCSSMCDLCGINAECEADPRDRQPKCVCPPGHFGSPTIRCYPLYRQAKEGDTEVIALNETVEDKPSNTTGRVTLLLPVKPTKTS